MRVCVTVEGSQGGRWPHVNRSRGKGHFDSLVQMRESCPNIGDSIYLYFGKKKRLLSFGFKVH